MKPRGSRYNLKVLGHADKKLSMRKGWDSNPRSLAGRRISSAVE